MTLDFAGVMRAAWRRGRADLAVLLPVAGLFFFVPQLALMLLLDAPEATAAADRSPEATQAYAEQVAQWLLANSGWYLAAYACAFFGVLTILMLYLDRRRPEVKRALGGAARLFLRYLLAVVLTGVPVVIAIAAFGPCLGGAAILLLIPAFWWVVRTLLAGAVIVAERPIGAARALERSWKLTRGQALVMAGILALVTFGAQMAAEIFLALGGLMGAAHAVNPIALALLDGIAALIQAAAALLLVLLQVEFYRRLSAR